MQVIKMFNNLVKEKGTGLTYSEYFKPFDGQDERENSTYYKPFQITAARCEYILAN